MLEKFNYYTTRMFVGAMVLASNANAAKWADQSGKIADDIGKTSDSAISALIIVAKLVGFGFAAWGVYEMFIAEDPQKQGKKSQGGMKIIGGIILIAIVSFISYISDVKVK
jgi:prolipoprotein diacylglyceryltransferase